MIDPELDEARAFVRNVMAARPSEVPDEIGVMASTLMAWSEVDCHCHRCMTGLINDLVRYRTALRVRMEANKLVINVTKEAS